MSSFEDALPFILHWEGGFVDDPDDRGGRTNKGVTQKVYDGWRAANGLPVRDVKQIGDDEVATIYREKYWQTGCCDRLRQKLDLVQFDTAVNMGTNRAIKVLQEAVMTEADGSFGRNTQEACDRCVVPDAVARYCTIREGLYRRFAQAPGQAKFLKGWLNRLNDLRVEAGVPGFSRSRGPADFGGLPTIPRIPDLGPEVPLEDWR